MQYAQYSKGLNFSSQHFVFQITVFPLAQQKSFALMQLLITMVSTQTSVCSYVELIE